jgi:Flp pilus assembly protein CpaB
MNKNRSMILMMAVLTGAIGAMLVYLYVQRVETSTIAGQATRPVLVATRFLPEGSPGEAIVSAGAFEVRDVPTKYVAPGAFSSPDELSGLILSQEIAGGEQLTGSSFSTSGTSAFFTDFPKGTEALSLPLEYISGVAGKIVAGDQLDAFVTVGQQREKGGEINIAGGIGGDSPVDTEASLEEQYPNGVSSNKVFSGLGGETFLMMRGVRVMEVLNDPATGNPPSMILAVRPDQAALLIHAQSTAKLWFTLVPPEVGSL